MRCRFSRGLAVTLACSFLFAAGAQAADDKGNFALRGIGAQNCGLLIEQMQQDQAVVPVVTTWLLGYVTAVNRLTPETYDISPVVDSSALMRMVVGVCQKFPDSRFETVVADVLQALGLARVKSDSPIVEAKSGDISVQIRQETLLAVQQALVQRNYLRATPDGIFGPRTEAALKGFQKDQELGETGVPDAPTVVRLLVELPAAQQ